MAITVEDFKGESGLWSKGYRSGRQNYATKSYQAWNRVRDRCKVGGKYQQRKPTYVGCMLSENFKDFQFFAEWCNNQVGYDINGYQLDKDIMVYGNKLYGEDTCVLVPQALNMFLVVPVQDNVLGRGVSTDYGGKYKATVRSGSRSVRMGGFPTPELAHSAYKQAKEDEAQRWYARLKAGEFVVDERVIERMRTWKFPTE